ncbi:unnamed protein product [Victoria cruziana]
MQTNVSIQNQQLLFNGKEMKNTEHLSAAGVKEGDLMMMVSNALSASANDLSFNPDGSAVNPRAFQQHVRRDARMMEQLLQNDPTLGQMILGEDVDGLQNLLRERHRQRLQLRQQQEEELALLYADPFDVEAQKKIEAMIQQRGIDENWEAALEHNPEAFARVIMLYVDMEVNGVPLKAFVDSGAQSTIISKSCAERCGLLRLLDQRYKGIAHGVGQSEILGRIHVAPIKIGHVFYPCSFMVLDSPNMEFLFGLDMLRKHQCTIDLKENVLRVGGGEVSVPFLQEKDIPSHFLDEERYSKPQSLSTTSALGSSGGTPKLDQNRTAASGSNASGSFPTLIHIVWSLFLVFIQFQFLVVTHHDLYSVVTGTPRNVSPQGTEYEAKVTQLMDLGFGREAVIRALTLANGNVEQAAGFLFSG